LMVPTSTTGGAGIRSRWMTSDNGSHSSNETTQRKCVSNEGPAAMGAGSTSYIVSSTSLRLPQIGKPLVQRRIAPSQAPPTARKTAFAATVYALLGHLRQENAYLRQPRGPAWSRASSPPCLPCQQGSGLRSSWLSACPPRDTAASVEPCLGGTVSSCRDLRSTSWT
jgi:hypothetical protein